MAYLPLIPQILATVSSILGIVEQIKGIATHSAQEHAPYAIETIAANGTNALNNPTYGLSALHTAIGDPDSRFDTIDLNLFGISTQLETVISDIANIPAPPDYAATLQAILDAIAALVIPGDAPTPEQNAAGVWAAELLTDLTAGELLGTAGLVAYEAGLFQAWPLAGNPLFTLEGPWQYIEGLNLVVNTPAPDWSDIGADETILAWLQRTDLANNWETDGVTGGPMARCGEFQTPGFPYILRPSFTSFPPRAYQPPPPIVIPPVNVAPVWPGSGDVTLGSPVALTSQLVLEADMEGVVVAVTTPPQKLGSYHVGGVTLDYGVGRIAFESDSGDLEPWQYLGFRSAIYTPKSMKRAAKARFQVLGGAEGTVTPWSSS